MDHATNASPSPLFQLVCPACGHGFALSAQVLPQEIPCPACEQMFQLPSPRTVTATVGFENDADSTPTPPSTDFPNIPGYELVRELGHGGMGVVYLARDVKLGRQVALKMILASKASSRKRYEGLVKRFRREAEAIARLQHPNIVQIFAIDECAEGPYFSMEYLEGGSLADLIGQTPQEPAPAARLMEILARAMQTAHAAGIVHRDLKPANVLLQNADVKLPVGSGVASSGGTNTSLQSTPCNLQSAIPKITDFGLAKQVDNDLGQTQSGAILGTPSYMAPEQANSDSEVGPLADVYALGAMLYHLLTGRPPFKGKNVLETVEQVRTQEPVPPTHLQSGVPRDLETICLKCLHKDPKRRYASAQALAEDLGCFTRGDPILARPVGTWERTRKWVRRHPARAGLIIVTLAALVGLTGFLIADHFKTQRHVAELRKSFNETSLAQKDAEKRRLEAVQAQGEAQKNAQEAIDKGVLAEKARQQAVERAVRLTLASADKRLNEGDLAGALLYNLEAARLEAPTGPLPPHHRLRLVAGLQQTPRILRLWRHERAVTQVAFDPRGERLLTASFDNTARIWDLASGKSLLEPPPRHKGPVNHAVWRADGQAIFTGGDDGLAGLWDARTGALLHEPLKHREPVLHVAFPPQPKGPLLTVSGNRHAVTKYRQLYQYEDRQVAPGVRINRKIDLGSIPIPPKGFANLWDDPDGAKPERQLAHSGWINFAQFSPDGLRVVTANCSSQSQRLNGAQVWVTATGEKVPTAMPRSTPVLCASFSSDGRFVVVGGGAGERGEAQMLDSASGEPHGAPLQHGGQVIAAWFSPNGQRVLTASLDETARVWDANTGAPVTPSLRHRERLSGAWFSPDGRRVLTASWDGSVRLWDAATGQALTPFLQHGSAVTSAAFSAAGPLLATGCQDGSVRIWDLAVPALAHPRLSHQGVVPDLPEISSTQTYANGKTRTLVPKGGMVATSVAFSPDGKSVLTGVGKRFNEVLPGGGQGVVGEGINTSYHCVWDLDTGKPALTPRRATILVLPERLSPGGQAMYLDAGPLAGTLQVELWDIKTGKISGSRSFARDHGVFPLGFDDQGKGCLLIVKRDVKNFESSAEMVDAASGAALFKIGSIPGTVEAAALSKDGGTLIMLSQRTLVLNKKTQEVDWQTQAWDLKAGGTAIHAHKLLRPVNQVALSADGQSVLLYQGGTPQALNFSAVPEMDREGEALLWRPREKKTTTLRHRLPVQHAAFSADGRLVVTASADRTARIWHVADGRSAAPALEHRDKVVHVAILGDRVVTSSLDHTARLWDLRTGELLAPPLHHAAGVLGAALSPDGLRLVTACEDGAAHVWDFSKDPPDRTGSATLLGLLTGHRLEETGGLVPMDLGQIQQAWNSVQKNLPDQVRPNPKLASVWRRGEMLQAWNAADWYASQVHLTHLMQEEPKEPRWVKMRAEARARLEEWNGAEEDFRQAIALGVEDVPTHFSCLLLQMHLGKKNDYQGAGQSLLRRVPREGNAAHSVQLLELLALKPDSVPGFDAAVALAEELVQAEGKSVEKRLALAALHVRAGQAKNALVLLEAEAKNVTIPGVRAAFFLCLAQRQLGQKEAADQWRQKAITGLAQLEEAPRYRRFWQERLALRMLRKELE